MTLCRVCAIVLLLCSVVPFPFTASAANCEFVLGFRTLHDLTPLIVGDCVTNESHNPANGDGLQNTTRGLLVWRKADNNTAFTDGYRTWVNGPLGLQTRLNTERFSWEADAAPPNVDPRLSAAYNVAAGSEFSGLIANVTANKIPVKIASLGDGTFGLFEVDQTTGKPSITIDQRTVGGDPNDAATVLIHEASHASDFSHGVVIDSSSACISAELRARGNELTFWANRFGPTGKPAPANDFERFENAAVTLGETNLRGLLAQTIAAYQIECGL